jgi:hypothetical protein
MTQINNLFFEEWIEHDLNPLIIFDKKGKIFFANIQAQLLLAYVDHNILFELSLNYSNQQFGFKKTFLELEYGHFRFNAINVGYKSEDFIGIQLYKNLESNLKISPYKNNQYSQNIETVNIYTVIDLCISANSINKKINFIKDFDPSFPEIKMDSKNLIKILYKIYSLFENSQFIRTELSLKIGEHVEINEEKYRLFVLKISGDNIKTDELFLDQIGKTEQFMINLESQNEIKKVIINAPFQNAEESNAK